MAHLYPIYLNLTSQECLVVGGGKVAERKVNTLLEYEARIKLVSPEVTPMIGSYAADNLISWRRGIFQPEDLAGISIVFAATGDNLVNQEISALCHQHGIWINAVDDPPNCDFLVPSILRRNSLCIAISTEGKSPLLAAKLRRELDSLIPIEYGEWVDILGKLREEIKRSDLGLAERQQLFESLVYSDLFDLLKEGKKDEVEERIKQCMSCLRE